WAPPTPGACGRLDGRAPASPPPRRARALLRPFRRRRGDVRRGRSPVAGCLDRGPGGRGPVVEGQRELGQRACPHALAALLLQELLLALEVGLDEILVV